MALPGVETTPIRKHGCNTVPEDYAAKVIDAEVQNGRYLKGRFKVNFSPSTKIDPILIKLNVLELKINEILSHPELTHLKLWAEVKSLQDILLDAEEKSPSQNT